MDAKFRLFKGIDSVADGTRTMATLEKHTTQTHNPLPNFCTVCRKSPLHVKLSTNATHVRCGESVRLQVAHACVTYETCEGLISEAERSSSWQAGLLW